MKNVSLWSVSSRRALTGILAALALMVLGAAPAKAQTTWLLNPTNGDWNTAGNWTPANVPNTAGEMAAFGQSNQTSVAFSADTNVGAIVFNAGMSTSAFTISNGGHIIRIQVAGVTNNSSVAQTFTVSSGFLIFDSSSAGNVNTIAYNVSGSGSVALTGTASAGSAVFTATGSNSKVIFTAATTGSAARFVGVGGALFLNIGGAGTGSIGSVEGFGFVTFSTNNGGAAAQTLEVGALGTDTTFSGVIEEQSVVGTLTKLGNGNLTLTGNNTYTGGTNVNGGVLTIDNNGITTFGTLGTGGTVTVNGAAALVTDPYGTLVFKGNAASAGNRTFVVNSGAVNGSNGGQIDFNDASTASTATFSVKGATVAPGVPGLVNFFDTATAGSASFTLDGGTVNFEDASNAGTAQFTINGSTAGGARNGVVNFDSGTSPLGTASASGATFTINGSSAANGDGGSVNFFGHSTGGDSSLVYGTFNLFGGTASGAEGGTLSFNENSNAGYAQITTNGTSVVGGLTSVVTFAGSASAGNATITNKGSAFAGDPVNVKGGGLTVFNANSTAGNANLIAENGTGSGGGIAFTGASLGGTSSVTVNGNGFLDISLHNAGSVSIGSLQGSGKVFLGANNLTVGTNNSSPATPFSGVIADGGLNGGTGGSFTKTGTGTLKLTGSSTYTGATIVNGGTLEFGAGGSLYTNGTVAGSVTVNNGGTVLFSRTDTFGASNGSLPVLFTVNAGGTIQSNNSYTALKDATFNGGSLVTNGGNSSAFQAFGLEGTVVIGGTTVTTFSTLGGGVFNGINIGRQGVSAATTFQVADATGNASSDLIVQVSILNMDNQASSLIKTGLGTMEINAFANYTGATTVSAGVLKVAGGGQIFQTSAVTVDGLLAANAALTVDGTGAGGSVVSTGNFTIGDAAVGTMNILNGGTASGVGQSYIGAQTGSTGTVNVSGAGSTLTSTGPLSVGWSGTGALNVTNGGSVSNSTGYLGDLAGSDGTALVDGVGSIWTSSGSLFVGNSSNGRVTVQNGGKLVSGAGFVGNQASTIGAATITGAGSVWNADSLTIGRFGTGTVNIENGGVVNVGTGTGTVTLGENADSKGTLNIGNGGAAGTLQASTVTGGAGTAIVNFNHTEAAYNFTPTITGSVSVNQNGPGTTILAGAHTYTGATNINAGTLLVDGSTGSGTTTVFSAGTLGGTGTIGGALINGGLVSPGHSPGTLKVTGPYTQNSTGTLKIEVEGRVAGQYDLLAVGGSATLAGKVQIVRLNNFQLELGDHIVFLTATGGVSGKFAPEENQFATGTTVSGEVVYGANTVALDAVQEAFAEVPALIEEQFPDLAREFTFLRDLSPNQLAVARALDSLVRHGHSKLVDFLNSRPLPELPSDFDKIAPEELSSLFAISISLADVQGLNLQRRTSDIRAGSSGFSASGLSMQGSGPGYTGSWVGAAGPTGPEAEESKTFVRPDEKKWGVFLTGVGEWVNTNVDGDGNARGYDINTGGFTLGLDYRVSSNFAVGIAAGYAGTAADLTGDGRVWVNGGKLGVYATAFAGGWYADLGVTGGYNSYDTKRSALQGSARGSTEGGELSVLVGTGYDWKIGALTIGPTAAFQYTLVGVDGFTEHGSLAPLEVDNDSAESARTALGLKATCDWQVGGVLVRPEIRAAWQHEYGDKSYGLSAGFATGGSDNFLVNGPEIGRDSLLVGAGVAVRFNETFSTYLYYDGEFGRERYDRHSITGGIRVAF